MRIPLDVIIHSQKAAPSHKWWHWFYTGPCLETLQYSKTTGNLISGYRVHYCRKCKLQFEETIEIGGRAR